MGRAVPGATLAPEGPDHQALVDVAAAVFDDGQKLLEHLQMLLAGVGIDALRDSVRTLFAAVLLGGGVRLGYPRS